MRSTRATMGLFTAVVAAGAAALLGGCASTARSLEEPPLDAVVVSPLRIQEMALDGVTGDGDWMAALLAAQATAAAQRATLEQRLAARVAQVPGARIYQLSGELRMPSELPAEVRGSWAAFRKGTLVSAHLVLADASGSEVASTDVELEWDDIRWTTGGPKLRRQRRTDLVLLDAASKAVELGVRDLQRLAAAAAATASSRSEVGAR